MTDEPTRVLRVDKRNRVSLGDMVIAGDLMIAELDDDGTITLKKAAVMPVTTAAKLLQERAARVSDFVENGITAALSLQPETKARIDGFTEASQGVTRVRGPRRTTPADPFEGVALDDRKRA